MKKGVIFLSFLLLAIGASAQLTGEPRSFEGALVDSLRDVEAYQYGKAPEGSSSPSTRQKNSSPEEKEKTGSAIKWLIFLVVAGILIIVAFVIIRQFSGTTGKRLDRPQGIPIETEEDLAHSDFRSLAAQAESANNWRLAYRYQYLWVLQQLQHKNQIVWHPYKTDTDYLDEVSNPTLKAALEPLVRAYSFIWYGRKEITNAQYDRLMTSIQSFS